MFKCIINQDIIYQRKIHLNLLTKYGKSWRESNDPLIKEITYDFDDNDLDPNKNPIFCLKDKSLSISSILFDIPVKNIETCIPELLKSVRRKIRYSKSEKFTNEVINDSLSENSK